MEYQPNDTHQWKAKISDDKTCPVFFCLLQFPCGLLWENPGLTTKVMNGWNVEQFI
jgi:hypothetical protein